MKIYIPLWLYYNAMRFLLVRLIRISTFHSGYITIGVSLRSIQMYEHLHSTLVILQLYRMNKGKGEIKNLHSTLVILQLMICFVVNTFYTIYIPLWLYYNRKRLLYKLAKWKSTFHSGYITILPMELLAMFPTYLHSTLVILQSEL